ncbi:MAG TPA: TonB-dependent receptor [Rubricoccaceae bacterium]
MPPLRFLALLLAASLATAARAQTTPDTLALPEVRVEAARAPVSLATAAFSVAVVERTAAERAAAAAGGLDVALRRVPGLTVTGRENPSQGERLVVRGLGARSAFGVRGVQVVLDGVPLTLADGQAVLGIVDPALVRRAEIVRGPASALWGNGSGGVLFLDTIPEASGPEAGAGVATAEATGGSFGLRRLAAEATAPVGPHRVGLALSRVEARGYRDYASFETTRARAFGDLRLGRRASLRLTAALEDAPHLDNPGALTADELAADPRQAEARTVETASGKASRQGQAAATLRAEMPLAALTVTLYGLARDLDNPLPFAYVAVDRVAGGTRLTADRSVGPLGLTLGVDTAVQRDRRTNRPNEIGTPGMTVLLDQTETVQTTAAFARIGLDLLPFGLAGVAIDAALRGDRVRFSVADRLLADGDQSGTRTLAAISPQLGIRVRRGAATAYASVSTAFDTPTTTELVNRPDGGGRLNPEVGPQRTVGVEAGVRGVAGRVLYDVAVYALAVRDGLTPAESADGRTFYVNRARIGHRGAEAAAEWEPTPWARLAAVYTWTRVRFGEGVEVAGPGGPVSAEGRAVPGIPEHRLSARAQVSHSGVFVAPEVVAASGLFADDLNAVRTGASVVVDVVAGHAGVRVGRATVRPFVRVGNVFGDRAVVSVVANARGGRSFEPPAARSVQAGVSVSLGS